MKNLLYIAAMIWPCFQANAYPLTQEEVELERLVWTATEHELEDLKNRVVRHIQITPNKAVFYYLISHINLRQFTNNPQDLALVKAASEMAQQAVDLEPKLDYGYISLAETLDVMGQTDKGIDLLNTASASGVSPTWRFYFTLARLNAQTAPKEKVLGLLEQSIAFTGSEPDIIVPYVVAVLQTTSQDDELLGALFHWDSKFPNNLFKQTIAINLAERGNHTKAHMIYEAIYKNSPSQEAKVNDAILLYKHLGKPKKTIQLLSEVLEDNSLIERDPEMKMVIHSHLAAAHLALGQTQKALDEFIESVKISKDPMAIIDFASKQYRSTGQSKHLSEFIKALTRAIQPSGTLYAILGETLSEDLHNHDAALRSFSDAILLNPERSDFYNGMGLTYYRMNKHSEALSLFREATKVDPNDATAMYNGACVLARLGRTEDSIGALEEALSLDPDLATHAVTDKDFAGLYEHPSFKKLILDVKMKQDSDPSQILTGGSEEDILLPADEDDFIH